MTDVQQQLDRLAAAPGDVDALATVEEAYGASGRWEELLRVYEDSAGRAERDVASSLWSRAADLCRTQLDSDTRAEAYLRRALQFAPSDVSVLRALRALYDEREDHERAAEVYERELAHTDDAPDRAEGLLALAEIYQDKLGRADRALSLIRQAERAAPGEPSVYRAIAGLYEQQNRLEPALKAILRELELRDGDTEVVERLSAFAGRLLQWPKMHKHARGAIDALAELSDEEAQRLQDELDSYREDWQQYLTANEDAVEQLSTTNGQRAADLWLMNAEIEVVYAKRPEAALAAIDKSLAKRPGHPHALRLLEEIFGVQERWDELALKLEMMASYTRDPAVAVELFLKAAMLYAIRLDDAESSSRIYGRVLQLDPGNKIASNALVEFYREHHRWQDALGVLRTWAEKSTRAEDKIAAHYAISRILEGEMHDREAATPHYEAILVLDSGNHAAAAALESVYRDANDVPAIAQVLEAKLEHAREAEAEAIADELIEFYLGPLDRSERALELCGMLYGQTPTSDRREQLEELAASSGALGKLVHYLEAGLERIDDDVDRIASLHSLAALYEGERDEPREALRIHRRILALDSADERARSAVERLFEAAAATGDKVAFYREQIDAAHSAEERATLCLRLAGELVEANNYVRAIDTYREALKEVPGRIEAIDGLVRLYERDGRWTEVAEMLTRKLEVTSAGPEKLTAELELARLRESKLVDVHGAIELYLTVLEIDPESAQAFAGLERLLPRAKDVARIAVQLLPYYQTGRRWDRVARMLEILATNAVTDEQRVARLLELARVWETQLDDPSEALAVLIRAYQVDPGQGGLTKRSGAARGSVWAA